MIGPDEDATATRQENYFDIAIDINISTYYGYYHHSYFSRLYHSCLCVIVVLLAVRR